MKKSKSQSKTVRKGCLPIDPKDLEKGWHILVNEVVGPFSEHAKPPARSWIEATFHGRDCIKFVQHIRLEPGTCRCGRLRIEHCPQTVDAPADEIWNPQFDTRAFPTNAYGTIEFQGGPHPSKAQYVRLSYDTRPELLLQLFTKEWNLELPKLLITVQGGRSNFDLQPKLKKILRKGLLKAAKTTEAWIFTGGINTGATRHVGDALLSERAQRTGRVVSLGIAPWGIVQDNDELIGLNKDVQYHSISLPRSKFLALNNRLTHFLLVDNGTVSQFGGDIRLRRNLEKYISNQKLHPYTHSSIPVVCLVIEGGTNAIRAVLEYVTDSPPVPVVVCDGSGRAADLIAFVHKHASDSGEEPKLEEHVKSYLMLAIENVFEVTKEKAECLYDELLQCCRKKKLITIFRISERSESKTQELDQAILTALFKSEHLTPFEQLSLSLTWNRVDIARSEIFVYGQEWPQGALDQAMMQALEHDRTDFVKLLLENGVTMRKFLTIPRLEDLYNTRQAPNDTLGYILRDLRPHIPRGYIYTLHDIGLVINKLMGGAYRSFYTRRKFRPIYAKVMNKSTHMHRNSSSNMKYCGNALSLLTEALPSSTKIKCLFDFPFNELLIWAVLLKRQKMAVLMFQHGEEALAKALVACKLFKAMAHEAAEDDMETEVYEELRAYAKEFENIALELLDYCYRQDDDLAQQLLTCELINWSEQTCLSLAVAANHRALLSHPCSQIILADLWMGGLRTRKNTNLKVVLGLLFPPYILQLEFKSKEELQLMPQTVEEHLELENDDDDKSVSERNLDAESLLAEVMYQRDTIVHENGKVMPDKDEVKYRFPIDEKHYTTERRNRPLKVKKKIYEFFTAPITKFWSNSIAYLMFLFIFSYTVLVRMDITPTWQEYLAISYICGLACEKVRELVSTEPVGFKHKLILWTWNMWNPCDATAIIFFLVALTLRLQENLMEAGRLMYCVNSIYWYLRILNILGVNKYLGPLVTMMGKMVKNMIYFVVLLLVVLMSFGVCRQAILYPNNEASWHIARDVFFEPYFMLYGEVFADGIDPPCGAPDNPCVKGRWLTPAVMAIYLLVANILLINLLIAVFNNIFNEVNAISHQVWMFQRFTVVMEYEQKPILPPPFKINKLINKVFFEPYFMLYGEVFADGIDPPCGAPDNPCVKGRWLTPAVMAIYLLVANILLINLLIAVFNNIFNEVNAISHQVWMFQRFTVVMEYEQKPILPPPFIMLCHLYLVFKYFKRLCKGSSEPYDNGLKLFLEKEDMERLYDFEEECVEGYFAEQEYKLQQSTEDRIKVTTERVENIVQKVEDINTKENSQTTSMQSVEFRLRKVEEASQDILEHLAVIHRFMASHSESQLPPIGPLDRVRKTSDRSETSDDSHLSLPQTRRKLIRSCTEVKPSTCFDESLNFEPRLMEADEERSDTSSDKISRASTISEKSDEVDEELEAAELEAPELEAAQSETVSAENLAALDLEQAQSRRSSRRRDSSDTGRRSSEGGNGESSAHGSKPSLTRRQISQTHSEPDNSEHACMRARVNAERSVKFAEPQIKVIPPNHGAPQSNPRSMLVAMHAEYTSITDELESMCGLLSAPKTPRLLSPPRPSQSTTAKQSNRRRCASEMSNPEIALFIEKEHLRDAEECDYNLMEDLIQTRNIIDEEEGVEMRHPLLLKVVNESREFRNPRSLRRASAIEDDIFGPLYSPPGSTKDPTERQESTESYSTNEMATLINQQLLQRPSIVIDSSHLPLQREEGVKKADSKSSLHMQSETMC